VGVALLNVILLDVFLLEVILFKVVFQKKLDLISIMPYSTRVSRPLLKNPTDPLMELTRDKVVSKA
jgi:hypothetical protein